MSNEDIPNEVRLFLSTEVRSLLALELLLLLRLEPGRRWTVPELSRELRATNEWADQELARLIERRLIQSHGGESATFSLAVTSISGAPGAEFAFGWLAASYPARRFSIIQCLYAPSQQTSPPKPDAVQHFADAFKIRKEPTDG